MALATTSSRRGVLDCVCFLAQTIVWFLITFSQQICLPIEMPRLGCCWRAAALQRPVWWIWPFSGCREAVNTLG